MKYLAWVSQALRVSHGDEKQHHDDAIRRIQAECDRLQDRIDAMYVDKLDGRIDTDFLIARPRSGATNNKIFWS